jgi:tetratricopeptide (TPR) repeat protein
MENKKSILISLCLATTILMLSGISRGKDQVHDLGRVNFPISCTAESQSQFNRAVALLHHMTYPQARKTFQQVTATDPKCAMAHWGVAMTLFQPLWPTRPTPEEIRYGWESVQKARALKPTQRENLFIEAAGEFFENPESGDYWQRIQRWEKAMERVYSAYPNDPEAECFYALALLAVSPPEKVSRVNADRAARILLSVYRQNPDHPGAMHYMIHANDIPGREHESLDIVHKYETIAPLNPHALHMPTHIYTRLGDWDAVIRGNLKAAEVALKYPAGENGQFVWDEFPHAVEYLIYAYLQKGADNEALAQLKRLQGTEKLQPSFKTAFHLASTQSRYMMERHAWKETMSLIPRQPSTLDWERFPWAESITWFARGLGAVHEGNLTEARNSENHLNELKEVAEKSGEALFARNIEMLHLMVSSWIANAQNDPGQSLAWMRQAADLEVSTPKHAVTPGPTLPAFEQLGDLLMEQSHPADALLAYKRSLELYPRRFNSLLGAARAAHATKNETQAREFYIELLSMAGNSTRTSIIEEARAFVSRRL